MKTNKPLVIAMLLFYMTTTALQAQEAIPASGGNASGSGGSVSYSFGQVVYITHTGTTGSVAEGVQHPYEIYTVDIKDFELNMDITVYPNPTSGNLTLEIAGYESEKLVYRLFDSKGQMLESSRFVDKHTEINTSPSPTINNFKTESGSGTGLFTSYITGLTLNTTYYIRAYATNANGTNYGPELMFKTKGVLPTVSTSVPHTITPNRAVLGGEVTGQGSAGVTHRGVCFGTSPNPTTSGDCVAVGSGLGSFNTMHAILHPNTTYHVRAFAINTVGTAYGSNQQFTTLDGYYEGFETNAPGWQTGGWGIVSTDKYEGFFSLYTEQNNAEASFTREFPEGGEVSFYLRTNGSTAGTGTVTFSINNTSHGNIKTYNNWLNHSFSVPPGTHTFKWKYNRHTATNARHGAWLDYVIMVDNAE